MPFINKLGKPGTPIIGSQTFAPIGGTSLNPIAYLPVVGVAPAINSAMVAWDGVPEYSTGVGFGIYSPGSGGITGTPFPTVTIQGLPKNASSGTFVDWDTTDYSALPSYYRFIAQIPVIYLNFLAGEFFVCRAKVVNASGTAYSANTTITAYVDSGGG